MSKNSKFLALINKNIEEIRSEGLEAYKESYTAMSGWNNTVSINLDGTIGTAYMSDNSFSQDSYNGLEIDIINFGKRELDGDCFNWEYIEENLTPDEIEKFEAYLIEENKNYYDTTEEIFENEKTFSNFETFNSAKVNELHSEELEFEVSQYGTEAVEQKIDEVLENLQRDIDNETIRDLTLEEINEEYAGKKWGNISKFDQDYFLNNARAVEKSGETIIDFHNLDISIAGNVEETEYEDIITIDNEAVFYNPIA